MYEWPKEKWSRFIGIVFQIESSDVVRVCLDQVESRYPDATHRCYAYKIWSIEKSSDAGEPAGTAGKPMLFAIQKSWYDNVLVVVIRYFGGTMLWAGGLVRAYGQCAREVLAHTPQEKKEVLEKMSLVCSYDDMPIVMQCMEKVQGKVVSQDAGVLLQVVCEMNRWYMEEFVNMLRDSSGGRVEVLVNE
jgi:uncharacterized YigZ family protein